MRTLERNKQDFYYALYEGKEEILQDGLFTGDYRIVYSHPVKGRANISPARGETQLQQFGESVDYDRVILAEKGEFPIDENSVLWVDTIPQFDNNGATSTPYDYTVKKVAPSINGVQYAIRKVKTSG